LTIVLSGGDVYLLGEAYAFGVVWSFFLKALGVLVLRYHRHDQEYKFPFNLHIGGVEIPVGLGATTIVAGHHRHRQSVLEEVRDHLRRDLSRSSCSLSSRFPSTSTARSTTAQKHGLEEFNLDLQPEVRPPA
jgi:hypothetical protein